MRCHENIFSQYGHQLLSKRLNAIPINLDDVGHKIISLSIYNFITFIVCKIIRMFNQFEFRRPPRILNTDTKYWVHHRFWTSSSCFKCLGLKLPFCQKKSHMLLITKVSKGNSKISFLQRLVQILDTLFKACVWSIEFFTPISINQSEFFLPKIHFL